MRTMHFRLQLGAAAWALTRAATCTKAGDGRTALHAYCNGAIKDHFYTVDFSHFGDGNGDWRYEGIDGYLFESPGSGRAPLYRYWSKELKDHFYTTDWSSLDAGAAGYDYEETEGYVLSSTVCDT